MYEHVSLHTVWQQGLVICLLCRRCRRRAVVPHETLGARDGNGKWVAKVRFVCSRCRARDFSVTVCRTDADVKRFFNEYRR